jgi:hypothetical protein
MKVFLTLDCISGQQNAAGGRETSSERDARSSLS